MNQKLSKAPKILGFIALAFSVIALICMFPIQEVIRCINSGSTSNLPYLFSNFLSQFQCFLISLILPMALLLIPRENGRKKAIVFIVITVFVILTQIVGNVINFLGTYILAIGESYLYTYIREYTRIINGGRVLNIVANLITRGEYLFNFYSFYGVMDLVYIMGTLISNILYLLQPVLCLVGFITLLKKKKTPV